MGATRKRPMVAMTLDAELLAAIDALRKESGEKRSHCVERLLWAGLDAAALGEHVAALWSQLLAARSFLALEVVCEPGKSGERCRVCGNELASALRGHTAECKLPDLVKAIDAAIDATPVALRGEAAIAASARLASDRERIAKR